MNRIWSIAIVVAATVLAAGCSAPDAELIDSPIVDELEEGIEEGDQSFDHQIYDELLDEYVDLEAGLVDYQGLAGEGDRLDEYLDSIAEVDLEELGADEQLALLINAYNAYTLELILKHYPEIDSIRDISSPWTTADYEVGGYELTLDEIEHEIIRPMYRDPRIHFVINCAARDCPYLADYAYTGDDIDQQLRERTEAILTDDRFVRVEDGELLYTRVMDWYEEDFVESEFDGHAPNVAQYIARYADDEVREFVEEHDGDPPASPMDYDWSLNDL